MSFTPPYTYISGKELADLIKSDKKPLTDYVVIDVRDDDFVGGNIVNCLRSPSLKFEENLDGLVEKTKNVPKVIFHCSLSQQRGPKAARIYSERRAADKDSTQAQDILVLRGGFADFQSAFRNDPLLVEKWRKEAWGNGWY